MVTRAIARAGATHARGVRHPGDVGRPVLRSAFHSVLIQPAEAVRAARGGADERFLVRLCHRILPRSAVGFRPRPASHRAHRPSRPILPSAGLCGDGQPRAAGRTASLHFECEYTADADGVLTQSRSSVSTIERRTGAQGAPWYRRFMVGGVRLRPVGPIGQIDRAFEAHCRRAFDPMALMFIAELAPRIKTAVLAAPEAREMGLRGLSARYAFDLRADEAQEDAPPNHTRFAVAEAGPPRRALVWQEWWGRDARGIWITANAETVRDDWEGTSPATDSPAWRSLRGIVGGRFWRDVLDFMSMAPRTMR